ncbi:MAG: hypothetical protein RRA94_05110 [Bacteroidota bacterium]|nr:hypothetical protein [Bacteroidota bacterium]
MTQQRRKHRHWGMLLLAAVAGMAAVLLPHLLRGGGTADFDSYVVFPLYATAWNSMHPVVTLLLAATFGGMLGLRFRRHWFAAGNAFLILHVFWMLLNASFGPQPIGLLPALFIFSYFILGVPAVAGAFLGARLRRILPAQR